MDEDYCHLTELFPSLIPLKGKTPIEDDWQKWCVETRPFNPEDFNGHNVGIPCGPANGILVVDVDDAAKFNSTLKEKGWKLPLTRLHITGRGGAHYVYRYPDDGKDYRNRSRKNWGFDIRGNGGQIVGPGSIHPKTGKRYEVRDFHEIAPAPEWVLEIALEEEQKPREQSPSAWNGNVDSLPVPLGVKKLIKEGEPKGRRSEAIMSVINSLVRAGVSEVDIFSVFETYAIGEKYREKGRGRERLLQKHIQKAEGFVTKKEDHPTLIFPHHVMSGLAGDFAEVFSSYLETPKEFLYMAHLTCLGSVLADRLTLASEIYPQPRLYVLLLGESADDRKSTAILKTTEHFKESMDHFHVCFGVGSAEGLQKRLKKDNRLLLCFDEFRQFVSKCKIEASVLLPCVNTLFESNRYESSTKKSDIYFENAYLSILAASTVNTYENTWISQFTDIGFNNRLFLVPGSGEKNFSVPQKVPDKEEHELNRGLGQRLQLVEGRLELDLTPRAREVYHEWYMNLERSIHAKRIDTYGLRLMPLLAVNDLKKEVDEETVRKVIAMCDWQLDVRRLHDPIDADNEIAKMEEKIRRVLRVKGDLKEWELKVQSHANRKGLWIFKRALINLSQAGEIWHRQKRVGLKNG